MLFVNVDIDECFSNGMNNCYKNVFCINMEGLYVCCCFSGYIGDGKNCIGKVYLLLKVVLRFLNVLYEDFLRELYFGK